MTMKFVTTIFAIFPLHCLGTYTIISYDTETGTVGGTGTTCLTNEGSQVSIVYSSLPNKGVVAAQSRLNVTARDIAIQRVKEGENSSEIIDEFQSNTNIDEEQYGILTSSDNKAFTGSACGEWAGNNQGDVNGFKFSFQGNILTSAKVGSQASAAFIETKSYDLRDDEFPTDNQLKKRGCELAWRLFHSVQEGAKNGQGDNRCKGRAGTTSFIRVDLNNEQDTGVFYEGEPAATACFSQNSVFKSKSPFNCNFSQRGYPNAYLSIEVAADGNSDPLIKLDEQFRSWAKINSCD